VSDEPVMKELGGPLGEDQQGVELTGAALDEYWAKEEERLGYPPKRWTDAERQRVGDDIKAAMKRSNSRWL